jgi:hypothetical protein
MSTLRFSRSREPVSTPLDSGDVVPMVVRWRVACRVACPCGARAVVAVDGRRARLACARGHGWRLSLPDAETGPDVVDFEIALDTSTAAA